MSLFIPMATVKETVNSESFCEYLGDLMMNYQHQLIQRLGGTDKEPTKFRM
jgi:hypothetical protein